MAKRVFFIVSVAFNFLFLLLLWVGRGGNTHSLDLLDADGLLGAKSLTSVFAVAVPAQDPDVSFGPAELSLSLGSTASLQFSVIVERRQSNLAIEPLYDHSVLSVGQSGFGILVTGIAPGESTLQLFSPSGFRDIAHVTVYP